MNSVNSLIKKISLGIEHQIHGKDSIFLVSFPKSGNTWMRFLMTNILKNDEEAGNVNFYNIHEFCPEWRKNKLEKSLANPEIYKSHSQYVECFGKVLYIVRDPRDVYVSYFHFMKKSIPSEWSFFDFIEKFESPYGTWSQHVDSWNRKKENGMIVIKYEDLLADAYGEMIKVSNFFEIKCSNEKIKSSIEKSSFDSMSKIEREEGRKYGDSKTIFVREGKCGQWKDLFGEKEMNSFLKKESIYLMEKFGYNVNL